MGRTPSIDKNGMKKGPWSPEEDNRLRAYVERYGHWNWRQLPKFAGLSRCGKSCRLRWMNYLRPDVKRGNYTKEEEDIIINLHRQLGNKWSAIAAKLPGRTDNDVKNHWHTNMEKCKGKNQPTDDDDETKEQYYSTDSDPTHEAIKIEQKRAFSSEVDTDHHETTAVSPIILESSAVVEQFAALQFSREMSSLSSDHDYTPMTTDSKSWVGEEESITSFSEFLENFWTEPFLAHPSCSPNDFSPPNFMKEGGFWYDDGMDFLYQEFPLNSS